MFPAIYHVCFWDEVDMKEKKVSGVTFGHNYVEAVQHIEDYYGDTIINFSVMFVCDEQTILEISDEEADRIEHQL